MTRILEIRNFGMVPIHYFLNIPKVDEIISNILRLFFMIEIAHLKTIDDSNI